MESQASAPCLLLDEAQQAAKAQAASAGEKPSSAHNREALSIEVDLSLPSLRVVRVLDQIAEWRGLPRRLRFDNGPEFTAIAVADWAEQNGKPAV